MSTRHRSNQAPSKQHLYHARIISALRVSGLVCISIARHRDRIKAFYRRCMDDRVKRMTTIIMARALRIDGMASAPWISSLIILRIRRHNGSMASSVSTATSA